MISLSLRVFVFLLIVCATAQAQPVVYMTSGSMSHKGIVTASGTGFGTKGTVAPVVWDDASGVDINDKWDGAWPDNNPAYNTTYRLPLRGIGLPHSRITRYIAGAHGDANGPDAGYNVIFFKTRTISYPAYTYASWYQRADDKWAFAPPVNGNNNYKTFAFSIGNTPYELPNNWYLAYNTPFPASSTSGASYVFGDDSNGVALQFPDRNGHTQWWDDAVNPMSGVWTKIEVEIKYTNQNDGYVKLWENGGLRVNYSGRTDRLPGTQRTEGIGGYASQSHQPNNWRYFADVYLDYSRARIILGNAPTYAASTIREVQVPTSWSDTSVSFVVNLGKLADNAIAYLYVVDEQGVANSMGMPVNTGSMGPQPAMPGS
jgi:hypothetical protein